MELTKLTIDGARSAIQERKTTASALAESFYSQIENKDGGIGAYLELSKERAMEKAAAVDAMAAKGTDLPPLAGVPVGIKDVMVTRGVRTTAGSKILGNYIPPYDCTAVSRLEAAGAVVLGKLNCDEFAMGSSNENSAWKPVHNPRDLSRVPGGSSGGSAAAVAADMAVATLDLWPGLALWIDSLRFVARPHWALHQDGERLCPDAANDCRPRSYGLNFSGYCRPRLCGRAKQADTRPEDWCSQGVLGRRP